MSSQDVHMNGAAMSLPGGLEFETVKSSCIQDGRLYEDPDFPAIDKSIFFSRKVSSHMRWKRPPDLCDNPQFIIDGATKFDLDQGTLGNCWFVAAAAVLATKPQLFSKVVPEDQGFQPGQYAGIFHFYFWRYGEWQEVVIDDRLPVKYGRFLLFCRNKEEPNEFWSALLEKAYAKLHGSYEALEGGKIQDALVDLTGGAGEVIELQDPASKPKDLFRVMSRMFKMNSLMGCSISTDGRGPGQKLPNGLVSGHAYSITHLVKLGLRGDQNARLIRLRNPYGHGEWNGSWSDDSAEWDGISSSVKSAMGLVVEDDGEFWMHFDDWKKLFTQLQICHMTPQSPVVDSDKQAWEMEACHGAWVRGVSAGGCGNPPHQEVYWTNPQFHVHLNCPAESDPDLKCTIIISLMQKYRRRMRTYLETFDTNTAIGFDLYRVTGDHPELQQGESVSPTLLQLEHRLDRYSIYREVCTHYELVPGAYCIIPATYYPDQDAEFYIRVVSENQAVFRELDDPTGPRIQQYGVQSRRHTIEEAVEHTALEQAELEQSYFESEQMVQLTTEQPSVAYDEDLVQELLRDAYERHANERGEVDARDVLNIISMVNKGSEDCEYKQLSLESCRNLVAMLDMDGRGLLVDLEQLENLYNTINKCKKVFEQFDQDNSDSFRMSELKEAFQDLGFSLGRHCLKGIMSRYGGKDCLLSFDDFVACYAKVLAAYNNFERHKEVQENIGSLEMWMKLTLSL